MLLDQTALLNHKCINIELLLCPFHDLLFHCFVAHKPVHVHGLCLPDTVRAVLRLQINLGVPVQRSETTRYALEARTIRRGAFSRSYQSLSYKITVSAVARLMPSPPARVESRKANFSEPGALKESMACEKQ